MNEKPPEVLYWSPGVAGMKNTHGLYTTISGLKQARAWAFRGRWASKRKSELGRTWRAKKIVWEEIDVD